MKLNKYILQWEEHQVCLKRVAILAPSEKWIHDNFDRLNEAFRMDADYGDWTSYENVDVEDGVEEQTYEDATDYVEDEYFAKVTSMMLDADECPFIDDENYTWVSSTKRDDDTYKALCEALEKTKRDGEPWFRGGTTFVYSAYNDKTDVAYFNKYIDHELFKSFEADELEKLLYFGFEFGDYIIRWEHHPDGHILLLTLNREV